VAETTIASAKRTHSEKSVFSTAFDQFNTSFDVLLHLTCLSFVVINPAKPN
jgi:hypothetical protein